MTVLLSKQIDELTETWVCTRIILRDGVFVSSLGIQGVLEYDEARKIGDRLEIRTRTVLTPLVKLPLYGEPGSELRRIQDAMVIQSGAFHDIILVEQQERQTSKNRTEPLPNSL